MRSWRFLDNRGVLLREVLSSEQGRGIWTPAQEMGSDVQRAIVAIEDKRFYLHPGVDPLAIVRALWLNLRNQEVLSGGSTLTQQLARQMYHIPRRWYLKPVEALLAFRLECQLSKEEILEQYLNRAPFGNQLFGVEAASRTYFAKPARSLSLAEAAFLCGLPQSPSGYNPYTRLSRALARQRQVLSALKRDGSIDDARYQQALAQPIRLAPRQNVFIAPHFCQMVLESLRNTPGTEREITTTLDAVLQLRIEALVNGHIEQLSKNQVTNAAVLVLENRTGAVKAWVGSRDFFSETSQGQVDGVRALRQPGSAIKPFTYGLALENGFTAASLLADIETYASEDAVDFTVHNYDEKYHGPVRLRTALACSYNVATVRLLESLGSDLLLERLRLAGLSSLNKPAHFYGSGLTLGNGEVTLRDLTNAYASMARGGELRPLVFVAPDVTLNQDESISRHRIFSEMISFIISDILSDHRARAPAFGLGGPLHLPFPCAAKTGTTKDFRDTWTIGYTTEHTVGVWVGTFDGKPMQRISGITGAAPLFRDVMLELYKDHDPAPFRNPERLVQVLICPSSGFLPTEACPGQIEEWFVRGTQPGTSCQVHKKLIIDRRNGFIAGPLTPFGQRETRVYEVWPPEYRSWMAASNLPIPPESIALADPGDQPRLVISFPDNGDIMKIDPVLRREYQSIMLQAVVPGGVTEIEWFVNDSTFARVRWPFQVRWPLRTGTHRFKVRTTNRQPELLSPEIAIQVF
jgi:penicillin-binding protein 1C